MKCTVISIFKDKNDGTIYRKGDELDLSEKRIKEINSTDAGTLVEKITTNEDGNGGTGEDGKTPVTPPEGE